MAGKCFSKTHPLLPIQNTFCGHQNFLYHWYANWMDIPLKIKEIWIFRTVLAEASTEVYGKSRDRAHFRVN